MTFDEWWEEYWPTPTEPSVCDAVLKDAAQKVWDAATAAERERCAGDQEEAMSEAQFSAKRRAWEDNTLNSYLRDWDVSDARDRAIEARAAELLELRGPKGYHPLDENVRLAFDEAFTAGDVFDAIRPHLEAGDHAAAGAQIAAMLRALADKEAAEESAIQIDREWNEASGAELDAYDDRIAGR